MPASALCVFAAASRRCDPIYFDAARALGRAAAQAGMALYTGGGSTGLMGAVADGAIAAGGKSYGILPRFMDTVEFGHRGLTELILVESMDERLVRMLTVADAYAALPGGCGTLEEILFVLTRKRLGLCTAPLILVNIRGYFDPLVAMLRRTIDEQFMDARHAGMWAVVDTVDEVIPMIRTAPTWNTAAAAFAVP